MPEAISAAVCQFPDLRSAVHTVIVAMQHGIPVARIELLDALQMEACIGYSKLEGFEAKPTLFFEFHGTSAGVREQAELMEAHRRGARRQCVPVGDAAEDRSKLWKARHNAYYAALALSPGAKQASPPTRACRSRGSPTACSRRARTSTARE